MLYALVFFIQRILSAGFTDWFFKYENSQTGVHDSCGENLHTKKTLQKQLLSVSFYFTLLIEANTQQNITVSGHRVNYSTSTTTLIISGLTFNREQLC